jgi:hypothetical protein
MNSQELNNLPNVNFVIKCYQKHLNRDPDMFGLFTYSRLLFNGVSRKKVVSSILSSSEYKSKIQK